MLVGFYISSEATVNVIPIYLLVRNITIITIFIIVVSSSEITIDILQERTIARKERPKVFILISIIGNLINGRLARDFICLEITTLIYDYLRVELYKLYK